MSKLQRQVSGGLGLWFYERYTKRADVEVSVYAAGDGSSFIVSAHGALYDTPEAMRPLLEDRRMSRHATAEAAHAAATAWIERVEKEMGGL